MLIKIDPPKLGIGCIPVIQALEAKGEESRAWDQFWLHSETLSQKKKKKKKRNKTRKQQMNK
jgi:hypothetical protein